jgi:hypothetical protein
MKNFQMADADNLEDVIEASKNSVLDAIACVISDCRKHVKQSGLTWDQIDFLLAGFREKKAVVIIQDREI